MPKQPTQIPEQPKRRHRKSQFRISPPADAAEVPDTPVDVKTKPHVAKSRDQIRNLSPESKAFYHRVRREWNLEDASGLLTLLTAAQSLDLMRQCQRVLARDGLLVDDRFGVKKAHPLVVTLKESRAGLLASLKALSLDLSALEDGGTE
jgi:hypothetical protein